MDQQPKSLTDRIAAAMAGHAANVSNGDGTVLCNCGTTVGANPAAWREHRADTVLASVQPELDQRDAEIRRLTAELHIAQRENSRLFVDLEAKRGTITHLRAELEQAQQQTAAVQKFAELDQDGSTCPHSVTRQLRSILAATAPAASA